MCETLCVLHTEGVSFGAWVTHELSRAVHTLVVWTGELSMRGKGMNSAPAFAAFEELKERYSPL